MSSSSKLILRSLGCAEPSQLDVALLPPCVQWTKYTQSKLMPSICLYNTGLHSEINFLFSLCYTQH